MEASPTFFLRFLTISALLHLAVGSIVVAMVRVGSTGPEESSAAVEVSLIEPIGAAAVPLSLADVHAASTKADVVASAPVMDRPAPVDAPRPEGDPVGAAEFSPLGIEESVQPRFDDPVGGGGLSLGPTTLAAEGSLGAAPEAGTPGGVEQGDAVRAWLERHKRYPRAAAQRGLEGDATLELLLDAAGDVRSAAVVQSSGHGVLDDEVTRMVARAAPFPPSTRPGAGVASYRIVIEFHLEEE